MKKIISSPLSYILITIIVFSSIYLFGKKESKSFEKNILKDPSLSYGLVTKVSYGKGLGYIITYDFSGENGCGLITATVNGEPEYFLLKNLIVGKSFPVIYNQKDPRESNMILISPTDFENFNITFPDSLNWIKPHLKSTL